jgi:hypothetical protein
LCQVLTSEPADRFTFVASSHVSCSVLLCLFPLSCTCASMDQHTLKTQLLFLALWHSIVSKCHGLRNFFPIWGIGSRPVSHCYEWCYHKHFCTVCFLFSFAYFFGVYFKCRRIGSKDMNSFINCQTDLQRGWILSGSAK